MLRFSMSLMLSGSSSTISSAVGMSRSIGAGCCTFFCAETGTGSVVVADGSCQLLPCSFSLSS